jgi:predicted transcriptional regulator
MAIRKGGGSIGDGVKLMSAKPNPDVSFCYQVSLWVDETTKTSISDAAKRMGRSNAWYMRQAIMEQLARDGLQPSAKVANAASNAAATVGASP